MSPASEASGIETKEHQPRELLGDVIRDISPTDRHDDSGLKKRVEDWFTREGVPQFIESYHPGDALPLMIGVLLIVGAFGMSVLPFLPLNIWQRLVAPAVLIAFLLPFLPLLQRAYSGGGSRPPIRRLLLSVAWRISWLSLGIFLLMNIDRSLLLYEWIDFVVSVCILLSLGLLLSTLRSKRRSPSSDGQCVKAMVLVSVLVLLLALMSPLYHLEQGVSLSLWTLLPVLYLLYLAIRARRALHIPYVLPIGRTPISRYALLTALSPAVAILWVQVVVLPYQPTLPVGDVWLRIGPFVALALSIMLAFLLVRIVRSLWPQDRRRVVAWIGFGALAFLAVSGYPVIASSTMNIPTSPPQWRLLSIYYTLVLHSS